MHKQSESESESGSTHIHSALILSRDRCAPHSVSLAGARNRTSLDLSLVPNCEPRSRSRSLREEMHANTHWISKRYSLSLLNRTLSKNAARRRNTVARCFEVNQNQLLVQKLFPNCESRSRSLRRRKYTLCSGCSARTCLAHVVVCSV